MHLGITTCKFFSEYCPNAFGYQGITPNVKLFIWNSFSLIPINIQNSNAYGYWLTILPICIWWIQLDHMHLGFLCALSQYALGNLDLLKCIWALCQQWLPFAFDDGGGNHNCHNQSSHCNRCLVAIDHCIFHPHGSPCHDLLHHAIRGGNCNDSIVMVLVWLPSWK